MWIAFDGANLTGKQLSAYWPDGYSDKNAVLTVNGYFIANDNTYDTHESWEDLQGTAGTDHYSHPAPTYNYSPTDVSFGGAFGLPAGKTYVDAVRHIEMAELQIFKEMAIDTGVAADRGAFIAGGKPVVADRLATKTSKVRGSIAHFGREPDVLLHTSKNWRAGLNTGEGGSSNRFSKTGQIDIYLPDPSLGGDQGKPQ